MAGKSRTDYREDLRTFLRDFAPFNRLLRLEEESSDPSLEFALDMALDTYNTIITPILAEVTFETFPSNTVMIRLAAAWLLMTPKKLGIIGPGPFNSRRRPCRPPRY